MVDTNEITGARLVTKVPTDEYIEGWERIFGKKKESIVWEDDLYYNLKDKENNHF